MTPKARSMNRVWLKTIYLHEELAVGCQARTLLRSHFKIKTQSDKENAMNLKLTAPKEITWWIAVVLGVIGLLVNAGILGFGNAFWFVAAAFIILAVATLVKGL